MEETCPQLFSQQGAQAGLEPRFSHAAYKQAGRRVEWPAGETQGQWGEVRDICPRSPSSLHVLLPPTGALEIGQALPIHTGRYTCTARNSAGVAHKHVVLTVQGKPLLAGGGLEAGRAG